MGVITSNGVIGVVYDVGKNTSGVISLLNKPNAKTAKKGAKLLKICTLGGLFSIYIGTF